jgi:hypothetical protein
MGAAVDATLGAADTVLFGRKTYDSFAGAWPERETAGGEDAGLAKALGDARKVVVSKEKLEFTWRNSAQLEGDLVEAVTALKNESGGNRALSGSVSVGPSGPARAIEPTTGDRVPAVPRTSRAKSQSNFAGTARFLEGAPAAAASSGGGTLVRGRAPVERSLPDETHQLDLVLGQVWPTSCVLDLRPQVFLDGRCCEIPQEAPDALHLLLLCWSPGALGRRAGLPALCGGSS